MPRYHIRLYHDVFLIADSSDEAGEIAEELLFETLGIKDSFFPFPIFDYTWEEIDDA